MLKITMKLSNDSVWNNIIVTIITVTYAILVFQIGLRLKNVYGGQRNGSGILSRKFIHICASLWILFWPLYDTSHWTWVLNITVPVINSFSLLLHGLIIRDPNVIEVQTMTSTNTPSELLYGPLYFCLVMVYLGIYKFLHIESAIITACLGIGDGLAPLGGYLFGKGAHRYSNNKTVEGSIAVFIGTFFGCNFFLHALQLQTLSLMYSLIYAFVATVLEGLSPGLYDNLIISFGVSLLYSIIGTS